MNRNFIKFYVKDDGEDNILIKESEELFNQHKRLSEIPVVRIDGILLFVMVNRVANAISIEEIGEKINILSEITDKVFLFRIPRLTEIKNPSESEMKIINEKIVVTDIMSYNLNLKKNYEETLISAKTTNIMKKNEVCLNDYQSEYVNIINNRRITTDDVKKYKNKLFVLGNSVVVGEGSEDKNTIPSFMQRFLNATDEPYRIINCGVLGTLSIHNLFEEVREGDKIIIILGSFTENMINELIDLLNIQYQPLNYLFNRPHSMEAVYWDMTHINYISNECMAKEIINIIKKKNDIGVVKYNKTHFQTDKYSVFEENSDLKKYIEKIEKLKTGGVRTVGSIVMNCNPFTLGHRYLIENTAEQVEHLYIFVVEEDKSYFKFEDRFKMVKEGTKELPNITVLPSGKFIISTVTFKDYFNNDNLNGAMIDSSMDVEIFAKYIAPALSITKRFAREGPNCYVTNQYNKSMRELLPKYGMEFVEIPRKESDSESISASKVRRLIKERDLEQIKKIVPSITYKYIVENLEVLLERR